MELEKGCAPNPDLAIRGNEPLDLGNPRLTSPNRRDRDLPNGNTVRGRITKVGKVATEPASEDAEPTIEVTIALRGRKARGSGLDQAPVDVGFASERRHEVLAVPVTALLARRDGFAVETADGRLVAVQPGLHAEDYVEVSGSGLRAGMRVVTAQ